MSESMVSFYVVSQTLHLHIDPLCTKTPALNLGRVGVPQLCYMVG